MRAAAAALIAAAVSDRADAGTWAPANPAINGTYTSNQTLDLDGDGNLDYQIDFSYGGNVLLKAFTVDSVNNKMFATDRLTRFDNRDDILTFTGPVVEAPNESVIYPDFITEGFAGLVFNIPGSGLNYGYLQMQLGLPPTKPNIPGPFVRITGGGYQPVPGVAVQQQTWSAIKQLFGATRAGG